MVGPTGSLSSVRVALDDADSELATLREEQPGDARDAQLARAYESRARIWRLVAELSFDDVVAGDLLARAARASARYDELLAERYRAPSSR